MDLNNYCYVCYSFNLHNRFQTEGIKYFIKGFNEKSHRYFWIYPKTNEVLDILIDWSNGVGK